MPASKVTVERMQIGACQNGKSFKLRCRKVPVLRYVIQESKSLSTPTNENENAAMLPENTSANPQVSLGLGLGGEQPGIRRGLNRNSRMLSIGERYDRGLVESMNGATAKQFHI